MAEGGGARKLALNSVLCFCLSKHGKLAPKRIKGILIDFFQPEQIAVAKMMLLADIERSSLVNETFSRYAERKGEGRAMREADDILEILDKLDTTQRIHRLPLYVTDGSDKLPSMNLEDGDLRFIIAKMDKMEAILHGLQTAVHSVHTVVHNIVSSNKIGIGPAAGSTAMNVQPSIINVSRSAYTSGVQSSTQQQTAVPVQQNTRTVVQSSQPGKSTAHVNNNNTHRQHTQSAVHRHIPAWAAWADSAVASNDDSTQESVAETSTYDDNDFQIYQSRRKRRRFRSEQLKEERAVAAAAATMAASAMSASDIGGQSTRQLQQRQPFGARSANTQNTGSRSRQTRKPLFVGKGMCVVATATTSGVSTVAAAKPFKAFYCIDNVNISTGVNELTEFVSSLGVRVISCFKVNPRLTRYQLRNNITIVDRHAFRLCINRADSKLLLQPEKWPPDVVVANWYFARKAVDGADDAVETATDGIVGTASGGAAAAVVADDSANVALTDDQPSGSVGSDETIMVTDSAYDIPALEGATSQPLQSAY